ncbi:proton-coupled amino acid transporter 2 [Aplysia californica]|uniref:Proton-coupled amino acid transporter 2 n=1 Tax=Aplysia californica TaxID=6500 RepID=A0ABM1AD54_APLCA|nr:proton-coupled amino acid transporter 2 [Aplysia californica]
MPPKRIYHPSKEDPTRYHYVSSDDDNDGSYVSFTHDVSRPLLSGAPTSFETSFPLEGAAVYDVTGAAAGTKNAARLPPDGDVWGVVRERVDKPGLSENPFSVPNTHQHSPDSVQQLLTSQSILLSTHSTIETENFEHSKCSNLQTLMNIIKGTIGTGILSLPLAFKSSGIWVGLFGFLLLASASVHSMHLLNNCAITIEKRTKLQLRNYQETVFQCFYTGPRRLQGLAHFMRSLVSVLIYIMQCSFCCIYIVWVATNVKPDLPDVSKRPAFGSWATMPMFFGTSVFSYESISLPFISYSNLAFIDLIINNNQVTRLYLSVNLILAAAMFISVGVQFYVPISVIVPTLEQRLRVKSERSKTILNLATRIGLITLICRVEATGFLNAIDYVYGE